MNYELILKPRAEIDVWESVLYYNSKRQRLGDEFLLSLEAKFNEIVRNPYQFPVFYKNIRRCFTARFPFGVYFTVDGDVVYIQAVVHTSRNPKVLKKIQ